MSESAITRDTAEFLAFTLDEKEHGIDILKARKIRGHESVNRIANAPEWR